MGRSCLCKLPLDKIYKRFNEKKKEKEQMLYRHFDILLLSKSEFQIIIKKIIQIYPAHTYKNSKPISTHSIIKSIIIIHQTKKK